MSEENLDLNALTPDEFINEKVAGKSDSEVKLELAKLEIEMKKQELELKQQEIEDMKLDREYKKFDRVVREEEARIIQGRRVAQLEANHDKMESLLTFMRNREAQQNHCNHRKGGIDAQSLIYGEGTSDKYAVIKHGLPNGNFFVICSRCGKEWHPARPYNVEGGRLRPLPATPGWAEAVAYPTDNTASASSRFVYERTELQNKS